MTFIASIGMLPGFKPHVPKAVKPTKRSNYPQRPTGWFRRLISGRKARPSSILFYESADELYDAQKSARLYPRVYGISHTDMESGITNLYDLIGRCHEQGARSIGLELSQTHMDNKNFVSYFKNLAQHAQSLDMSVISLITDSTWKRYQTLAILKAYIDYEGQFDRNALVQHIEDVESDLGNMNRAIQSAYSSPEEIAPSQLLFFREHLQRLQAMHAFLEDIDYSVDAYAATWSGLITQVDDEMALAISSHRPDIAFVGAAHAAGMKAISGYEVLDIKNISAPASTPLTNTVRSSAFYKRLVRSDAAYHIELFLTYVQPMVCAATGIDDEAATIETINDAFNIEPKFFKLAMRAGSEKDLRCGAVLFPLEDVALLKMSTREAEKEVRRIIEKVAQRRRTRNRLWPF